MMRRAILLRAAAARPLAIAASASDSLSWRAAALAATFNAASILRRSAAPPPPPKNNNSNRSGKQQKEDDEDDDADDAAASGIDDVTPKITRLVLGTFLVSYILYRMAQPHGDHVGWASVERMATGITDVEMYDQFTQFYWKPPTPPPHADGTAAAAADADAAAKNGEGGPKRFFVGAVDDSHTNDHLARINALRASAATTAAKQNAAPTTANGTNETTDVRVNFIGTPMAERALYAVGVVAWVVPFIFFPSFVLILTRAMSAVVASTAERGGGSGGAASRMKAMTFPVQYNVGKTKFADIAGMREAKREITEIVDILKRPERYTRLGAKVPTGAMLLGPPGTGKTLLARAIANEAGVGFIAVCGSDFVELYAGMGALRVRQLFESAKKQRCIVYIDEIDAIGLRRRGAGFGEKHEQEHTLNELLTQLDGFGSARGEVMILASSNVPQSSLDPALIRPGRFDRIVHVDAPLVGEREEIFKVHLAKLKLVLTPLEARKKQLADEAAAAATAASAAATATMTATVAEATAAAATTPAAADAIKVAPNAVATTTTATASDTVKAAAAAAKGEDSGNSDADNSKVVTANFEFDFASVLEKKTPAERELIESFAKRMCGLCPGFVGADIANVCNEAAILAAREQAPVVTISHLERSIDRVLAGVEQRSRVLSDFERTVVAHHEAGHAVAGWFLNRADPLMKVSIVPRGGKALGYAQYLPNENQMRTAREIVDAMCVTLGGRVAEEIFFGHLSTGASDDLQKVTKYAYAHVSSFGGSPASAIAGLEDDVALVDDAAKPAAAADGTAGGGGGAVVPLGLAVRDTPGSSATRYMRPYGTAHADRMDAAAKRLVDAAYAKTKALLLARRADMEALAKHLLENEVLTHADVVKYLGDRPLRDLDRKVGV